jgi:hypothetical protein
MLAFEISSHQFKRVTAPTFHFQYFSAGFICYVPAGMIKGIG